MFKQSNKERDQVLANLLSIIEPHHSIFPYCEKLQYDKNVGWTLIGILDKTGGTFVDRENFCIHDYLFDIIQSTHQDNNIMLKFISNEIN